MIWCKLENIYLSFGSHNIISQLSFNTRGSSFIGIIGSSGIGKSTILNLLAGVSQAEIKGNVCWYSNDKVLLKFPRPIGLVEQGSPIPGWLTVEKFLKMCILKNNVKSDTVDTILELFHMEPNKVMNLFPHELSGGMKARVALAGAMNIGAKLMFLDEPFSGVDEPTRHELVELLSSKSIKSSCINFIVSHSILEVMFLCNIVLFLKNPSVGNYKIYPGYKGQVESLADLRYGRFSKNIQEIEEEIRSTFIHLKRNK